MRHRRCVKHVGRRVWLAASGTSTVYGHAVLAESIGPLSEDTWSAMRARHHVHGPRMYGGSTHAYVLRHVSRCEPLPIQRKAGAMGFQTGPWAV